MNVGSWVWCVLLACSIFAGSCHAGGARERSHHGPGHKPVAVHGSRASRHHVTLARLTKDVAGEPGVMRPTEILTMHFGPKDVLVALSLDFEDRRSAADVEAAVTQIERRIKAAHPEVSRVFVEAQSLEAHRRNQALITEDETG
jgi:hypothetical protein